MWSANSNVMNCVYVSHCLYLAPQHEDGVDVRQDAVIAEVNVRTDQREDWWEDTRARVKLGNPKIKRLELE